MDFRDTADEAAFRAGLRAWLRDHRPSEWQPDTDPKRERWGLEQSRAWSRRLFQAGYMGLTWPKEHGGQAAPYTHQAILLEEIARAEAPEHVGIIGLAMAGPTLIAHGTEAQKKAHLDKILSADEIFCQGFSEPGAGSDLASLRTRAERDGDGFVLNGQKVWSSFAHIADWCILLARTNPDAPKHKGLTYFLVDMHAPGVEVRPLRQLTGDPEFNEIFLTDVRVPADQVVGEVDGGWGVAMTTLLHERGTLGFLVRTGIPGPEGSVAKLHWSEANQRLGKLALEVLGTAAQLDGGDSAWGGYWQYQQLRSRGNTIEAGTSEVLRNIIAERVLGLPRSR
jgi:alkylation response protein AidB-like acyl-CoA dehydrogenase